MLIIYIFSPISYKEGEIKQTFFSHILNSVCCYSLDQHMGHILWDLSARSFFSWCLCRRRMLLLLLLLLTSASMLISDNPERELPL